MLYEVSFCFECLHYIHQNEYILNNRNTVRRLLLIFLTVSKLSNAIPVNKVHCFIWDADLSVLTMSERSLKVFHEATWERKGGGGEKGQSGRAQYLVFLVGFSHKFQAQPI